MPPEFERIRRWLGKLDAPDGAVVKNRIRVGVKEVQYCRGSRPRDAMKKKRCADPEPFVRRGQSARCDLFDVPRVVPENERGGARRLPPTCGEELLLREVAALVDAADKSVKPGIVARREKANLEFPEEVP